MLPLAGSQPRPSSLGDVPPPGLTTPRRGSTKQITESNVTQSGAANAHQWLPNVKIEHGPVE